MGNATKKLSSEDVTMLCIRFCEGRGLLNRCMSLSTIEYIRYDRKLAVAKLKELVQCYGNKEDQEKLKNLVL